MVSDWFDYFERQVEKQSRKEVSTMVKAKKAKKSRKVKADKTTTTSKSVMVIGSGKAGHTLASATQVAEMVGVDPKRFRAWLRSGEGVGNDGKYTTYRIDLDSKEGKTLVKQAAAYFG